MNVTDGKRMPGYIACIFIGFVCFVIGLVLCFPAMFKYNRSIF